MTEPAWLIEARRQVGVREIAGAGNSPVIMRWSRNSAGWLGIHYSADSVPWCGLFIAECMTAAGYKPPRGAIGVRARWWLGYGTRLGRPAVPPLGAIAVLERGGAGHVFFVTEVSRDGKRVRGIGGNQSDMVSEAWFEADRLLGYVWPPNTPVGRMVPTSRNSAGPVSTGEA